MRSLKRLLICGTAFACISCDKGNSDNRDDYNGDNRCFTPCKSGLLQSDGTYLACSDEGLMAGCLDNRICSHGSCQLPDAGVSGCESDVECPDFQRCINDYCQVGCETNNECEDNLECYRHVCRLPCSTIKEEVTSAVCAENEYCKTADSKWGYCMPKSISTAEHPLTDEGTDDEKSTYDDNDASFNGSDTSTDEDTPLDVPPSEDSSIVNPGLFEVSLFPLAF